MTSLKNNPLIFLLNIYNDKNLPSFTVCDNSGTEKKFRAGLALEECKSRCLNDDKCLGFEFGKGGRKGECYLNHDQNVKYRGQEHFDGWRKNTNCSNFPFFYYLLIKTNIIPIN